MCDHPLFHNFEQKAKENVSWVHEQTQVKACTKFNVDI